MKKPLLVCALVLSAMAPAELAAEHVSPQQALNRLQKEGPARVRSLTQNVVPQLKNTIGDVYLFTTDISFFLLPATDEAPALLGYSENGASDLEINPGLKYWIEFYNRELSYIDSKSCPKDVASEVSQRPERTPIAPLIATKWNQEAPYNDLCPKVNGHETVTGCVATAMAQVMKYHSYPEHGRGSHSYYWKPGDQTLSFDYSNTPFKWDLMTDVYNSASTQEEREAVATLMLACGISVDMHYDIGDSGSSSIVMGVSLMDYFEYDDGLWMPMRDYYGIYEWEDLIYADLAKGLPVLYSGQGTAGGHQFICDGYKSDGFFHFNWGWGGLSNGYFLLTALNPDDLGVGGGAGGFNSGQQIALGVQKPQTDSSPVYIMYCGEDFTSNQSQISAGEDLKCGGSYYNYSMHALPEKAAIGMKITNATTDEARYEEGYGIHGLGILNGYAEDLIRFPELEDGDYVITPAFYDGDKWNEIRVQVGRIGKIFAHVENKVATLSHPELPFIEVTDIKAPEIIYKNRKLPLIFTLENKFDEEVMGKVTPVLINPEDKKIVATSQYRPIDVVGNDNETISDYIADFSAVNGAEFADGSYNLVFRDNYGKYVSDPVEVTVETAPEKTLFSISDFKVDSTDPVMDKGDVRFSFKIDCTEGYFDDKIRLDIFPGDGGYALAGVSSEMLYMYQGESKEITLRLDLTHLKGGDYMAGLYKSGDLVSKIIHFRIDENATVIFEISDDYNRNPEMIYDLQGKPAADNLTPGIYVINGAKVIFR